MLSMRIAMVAVVGLLGQGCLLWVDGYRPAVPNHAEPAAVVAAAEPAPRIRWVIYNSYRGGDNTAAMAGARTHGEFKRAFERAQTTMPWLAKASIDEADPEYLLVLSTGVEEDGLLNAYFFGFTLGIVPLYIRSDIIVGATLQTTEGENLISHQAATEVRGIAEILLLPVLPWTLIKKPGDEVYDEPMRSALGAVATDFTHLRAGASRDTTARGPARESRPTRSEPKASEEPLN
jgi:hypothetical protein